MTESDRKTFSPASTEDLNRLLPADIILFELPSSNSHIVSKIQSFAGYSDASRIVHAAVYLDHGTLCHAKPAVWTKPTGGIFIELAWSLISSGNRRIYVLRDRRLTDLQRHQIAVYAATKTRKDSKYDWKAIFDAVHHYLSDNMTSRSNKREKIPGKKLIRKIMNNLPGSINFRASAGITNISNLNQTTVSGNQDTIEKDINADIGGAASFICSDFVSHIYNFALGENSPFNNQQEILLPLICPADIYENDMFVSVTSNSLGSSKSSDLIEVSA